MSRRKLELTAEDDPPSVKISKKSSPQLNQNARITLIAFFAINSHDASLLSTDSVSDNDLDMENFGFDGEQHANNPDSINQPEGNDNIIDYMAEEILGDPDESDSVEISNESDGNENADHQNLFDLYNADSEDGEDSEDEDFMMNEPEENDELNVFNEVSNEEISSDSSSTNSSENDSAAEEPQFLNLMDVLINAVEEDENNSEATSSYVEEDRCIRRALIISRRFLDSYFNDKDYELLLKAEPEFSKFDLILKWNRVMISVLQLSAQTLGKLIRLSNLQRIYIMSYPMFDGLNSGEINEAFNNWVQVCKALKESKNLKTISIETGKTRPSSYRAFFDLLPDKIHKIRADGGVFHLLNKRKSLKTLQIIDNTKSSPDYSQIFKTKTTKLDLSRYHSANLNGLGTCGRIAANPLLKELKIYVRLIAGNDQDFKPFVEIEKALNCLGAANSQIKLEFTSNILYGEDVLTVNRLKMNHRDAIIKITDRLDIARDLIDLVKESTFELSKISIHDSLLLNHFRRPNNVMNVIGKSIGLKTVDDETICDSFIHNGVKVHVKLCLVNPDEML